MSWLSAVGLITLGAVVLVSSINSLRLRRGIRAQARKLLELPQPAARPIDRARLARLPPPVRRFLAKALGELPSALRNVKLRHGGAFRPGLNGRYLPIRGEEYVVASPPGFVWWGRLHLAPGLWVDACDRSLAGEGNLRISAESTVLLEDLSGPDLDQGELLRLLAELVLIPSALLDEEHVSWEPIDEHAALATLRVGGRAVSARFEFGEDHLPTRISAQRGRLLSDGSSVQTPWSGEFRDFRQVDGVTVPFRFAAAWQIDGKRVHYADFAVEKLVTDASVTF